MEGDFLIRRRRLQHPSARGHRTDVDRWDCQRGHYDIHLRVVLW